MKIRAIDRILLFLLALIGLIGGIIAALREFGINVLGMIGSLIPLDFAALLGSGMIGLAVRIAAIVIVILLSFYLFSISFRRKKKPDPFINMESGSKGSIRMSMESISGLVLRTCGNVPGITGMKVSTINHEDSVSVDLTFQVEMTRNIPELSAQIQEMVGDVVEKNCGVAVRKVCVTVSGFTAPVQAKALPERKEKPAKRNIFNREKKAEIPAESTEVREQPAVVPVIVPEEIVEEVVQPVEEPAAEPQTEEVFTEEPAAEEPAAKVAAEEEAQPVQTEEYEEYAPVDNE